MPQEFVSRQETKNTRLVSKFLTAYPDKANLLKRIITVLETTQTLAIFVLLKTECIDLDEVYRYLYE